MVDMGLIAREEIIEAEDFASFFYQSFAQVGAEKSCTACNENALFQ